jgi:tRNA dimethylallyltransferase
MQKLLTIVGPTATGKTTLAIALAEKHNGEIISADSRQVYRGMDVGTGKQRSKSVKIWGYDLVDPDEDFSVSHFQDFVAKKIVDIDRRGKLPILVGGTGLYIHATLDGIQTAHIPQDTTLRQRLDKLPVVDLVRLLASVASAKLDQMNVSDRQNPRRLIRAIEVANSKVKPSISTPQYDVLVIGLTAPLETLYKRVEDNIHQRIHNGVFNEVTKLLASGASWNSQAMTSLGYRQLRGFFDKEKTQEQVISEWINEEKKYVKRQLTWFKKDKRVRWVSILEADSEKKVEEYLKTWENKQG